MMSATTLSQTFGKIARDLLSYHPEINHHWIIRNEHNCSLKIPKTSSNGFDVNVDVSPHEIKVFTEGAHRHFDFVDGQKEEDLVHAVLGLVRDLLSPHMRLRILLAGKQSYRWQMEVYQNGKWQTEETTGLLLWNFLGKRSEIILQNELLPGRSEPLMQ